MLLLAVLQLLLLPAAQAQECPSQPLAPYAEGCAFPLPCPCAAAPLYDCDARCGACVADACTGCCHVSAAGWGVFFAAALVASAAAAIACRCYGCSVCRCRRGAGARPVYAAVQPELESPRVERWAGDDGAARLAPLLREPRIAAGNNYYR